MSIRRQPFTGRGPAPSSADSADDGPGIRASAGAREHGGNHSPAARRAGDRAARRKGGDMLRTVQRTDPKYYAGRRLAKRQREMHISLLEFLKEHNWKDIRSPKPVSADYQHKRYTVLAHMMLVELVEEGYQPTHLKHIKPKHFVALGRRWKAKKLDPQTMQNKLRILAWVCRTLKKHDCIPDNLAELLPEPELHRARGSVAREEKTFSGHGIDPVPIILRIAEKDARVALIQLLKAAFGLRNKEAIRLRPHEADHGTYLRVEHGTKGGRVRTVSYFDFEGDFDPEEKEVVLWNLRENRFRVQVIGLAKALVPPDHSMIPLDYSPKRYQRYERYVTARYGGLTKAEVGLTPHAFRHEFSPCGRRRSVTSSGRCAVRSGSTARKRSAIALGGRSPPSTPGTTTPTPRRPTTVRALRKRRRVSSGRWPSA